MPDVPPEDPLATQPDEDAEPEHQEPSAMAKLAALREKHGWSPSKAEIDAEQQVVVPYTVPGSNLGDRLWSALDRSVSALERTDRSPRDATADALVVRNIAETLDRLGLLKPPPPPVEAPEPDVDEVWFAASEAGLSTEECDRVTRRLRERYEGRA
jgi:hypothetical protein